MINNQKISAAVNNRRQWTPEQLISSVENKEKGGIARALSILDNDNAKYKEHRTALIDFIYKSKAIASRIAISGAPGAGKSTLIEAIGPLVAMSAKVAVIAIDPTSSHSGGSILGDKTRMQALSILPNVFIRPEANHLEMGGIGINNYFAVKLLEAVGYEVIFIETVGAGQSEFEAFYLADLFWLVIAPAGGDDLQGMKKGIAEMADIIVINKSDGENVAQAIAAETYMKSAVGMAHKGRLNPARIVRVSAIDSSSTKVLWDISSDMIATKRMEKNFTENRIKQDLYWVDRMVERKVVLNFRESALRAAIQQKAKESIISLDFSLNEILDQLASS